MDTKKTQNEKQPKKKLLRRFAAYYRLHLGLFTLDMLASLLISAVGMVYPIVTKSMLNDLIPNRQYRMIVWAGLIVLFLYIVRMLLRWFVQYYGHMIGVGMQEAMRNDLFCHLEKLPFSFYDNHETGKIMSRLTSDLFDISELAHHGPENILTSVVMITGSAPWARARRMMSSTHEKTGASAVNAGASFTMRARDRNCRLKLSGEVSAQDSITGVKRPQIELVNPPLPGRKRQNNRQRRPTMLSRKTAS